MRFNIASLAVHIHPLLPLSVLLMACLGASQECLMAFGCVLLHELGHLTAAALLRVPALSLEVMPLGGVLHIGGLYRLSAGKLLIIALSGPMISLLLALAGVIFAEICSMQFVLMNLLLFAFNLLPGLPMDGGRILTTLLRGHIGIRRSIRFAACVGRCIGAVMVLISFILLCSARAVPIPLPVMGVYLLSCAGKELADCECSAAEDLAALFRVNRIQQPIPVQAYFCEQDAEADRIIRILRADRCTLLFHGNGFETDLDWLHRQMRS